MTKIVYTCLVLSVFCLSACQLNDSSDEKTLIDVEDEFIISMWESLSPSKRSFRFVVQTISQQDCTNATINFSKEQLGQSLSFSLNNVQYPEVCDPGEAPANANIAFTSLEPGTYKLSIYLKETIVNQGTLTVSSVGYQLQMSSEIGFQITDTQLYRIFDQSIWGYITYNIPNDLTAAQAALAEITSISEERAYQIGNYGYFSVVDNSNKILPKEPIGELYESFLYHYGGDINVLKAKLEELRSTYAGQLNFTVFTADGASL